MAWGDGDALAAWLELKAARAVDEASESDNKHGAARLVLSLRCPGRQGGCRATIGEVWRLNDRRLLLWTTSPLGAKNRKRNSEARKNPVGGKRLPLDIDAEWLHPRLNRPTIAGGCDQHSRQLDLAEIAKSALAAARNGKSSTLYVPPTL